MRPVNHSPTRAARRTVIHRVESEYERFDCISDMHKFGQSATIESFSKSRYRPNSRYFHRNFKNSVKSIAFLRYPGPNSVGRNAIF